MLWQLQYLQEWGKKLKRAERTQQDGLKTTARQVKLKTGCQTKFSLNRSNQSLRLRIKKQQDSTEGRQIQQGIVSGSLSFTQSL